MILTPFQNLPYNLGSLGKIIVTALNGCPECRKSPNLVIPIRGSMIEPYRNFDFPYNNEDGHYHHPKLFFSHNI